MIEKTILLMNRSSQSSVLVQQDNQRKRREGVYKDDPDAFVTADPSKSSDTSCLAILVNFVSNLF